MISCLLFMFHSNLIPVMNQQTIRFAIKVGARGIYNSRIFPSIISCNALAYKKQNKILNKQVSTQARSFTLEEDDGVIAKISRKIKFNLRKHKLRAAGFYLYEKVADELNYPGFITELKLPDTFQTWFLITELHVWMIMVKLMSDPQDGRYVRNCLVEALWNDVVVRSKKLDSEISQVKVHIQEISEQFQASLVSYDEGILSGDIVLAGAVWRRILDRQNDPENLEALVKYIRKMVFLFDRMDLEEFLFKKNFKWPPVKKVFSK